MYGKPRIVLQKLNINNCGRIVCAGAHGKGGTWYPVGLWMPNEDGTYEIKYKPDLYDLKKDWIQRTCSTKKEIRQVIDAHYKWTSRK